MVVAARLNGRLCPIGFDAVREHFGGDGGAERQDLLSRGAAKTSEWSGLIMAYVSPMVTQNAMPPTGEAFGSLLNLGPRHADVNKDGGRATRPGGRLVTVSQTA
jgi:hypothetical protein